MDYSYSYDYGSTAVNEAALAGIMGAYTVMMILAIIVSIISIVALWKIFAKAGEPGWAAIVPFYNNYVLFKITMGNGWLFLLMFVPLVNIVMSFMVIFKLAKVFGHGIGFGFGLLFLQVIFLLILAFGSSEYEGV